MTLVFYILLQLSNTLVRLCVSDLDTYCSNAQHQFWSMVSEAIHYKAQCPPSKPTKGTSMGCSLIAKLESYLQLRSTFRDFLFQVRDTLLIQHINFSHLSSSKKVSLGSTASGSKKSSTSAAKTNSVETGASLGGHLLGVPLQNTDKIMTGMDNFASLVSNVLELVSTLGQFTRINLEQRIRGLPRFSGLWKLEFLEGLEEQEEDEDSLTQSFNQSDGVSLRAGTVPGDGSVSDITLATPDYLDMLISKNLLLQQQQQLSGSGSRGGGGEVRRSVLHSEALSTLKEESWVGSVQSNEEEHKPQGLLQEPKTLTREAHHTTEQSGPLGIQLICTAKAFLHVVTLADHDNHKTYVVTCNACCKSIVFVLYFTCHHFSTIRTLCTAKGMDACSIKNEYYPIDYIF